MEVTCVTTGLAGRAIGWRRNLLKWLKEIGRSETITDIFSICADEIEKLGADRSSYHCTPSYTSQVSADTLVIQRGFSRDWIDLYEKHNFRECDPIPNFVMAAGVTMTWQSAIEQQSLTQAQCEFVDALRAHGIHHGVGSPLFGQKGMEGYAAIGFDDPVKLEDQDNIREMITIVQAGHRRANIVMQNSFENKVSLSKRETEVLHWIARSKSNTDIATILGVSATTVEVYVRRLYEKLKVNDRIAATVRGLRWGLVKL